MAVVLFGFRRLMTTDYGLVLKAIRDNDRAVMSGGINIYWLKAQALFIAGSVGAFCGRVLDSCLFVRRDAGLCSGLFHTSHSICRSRWRGDICRLHGRGLHIVPLSEALRGIGGLRIVIYALALVVCIVSLPEGIFHYIQRKYQQFERWVEVESRSEKPKLLPSRRFRW